MMNAEAIQRIVDLAPTTVVKHGDMEFASSPNGRDLKRLGDVHPAPIILATLTGLADYLKANVDPLPFDRLIHVTSPHEVDLYSPLLLPWKGRDVFSCAKFDVARMFRFNQFIDHEDFIIEIQTRFVDTPARSRLLKLVGNIRSDESVEQADDGVSQIVHQRAGVSLIAEAKVENPFRLKPFRTFAEIDQPESDFILRVRDAGNDIQCALFECDGGAWKLDSAELIKAWLAKALPSEKVIL